MTYETITLDIADRVATITLNRPDRLNACSLEMADEIGDALDQLEGARALMLTGAGRAFCSGADLQMAGRRSVAGGPASFNALTRSLHPMLLKLSRVEMPVVTAVNGAAAGIGCSLALTGDFVVAARSAYFLQAFVNIGLIPDGGASWLLPRLVGKARATEMMMLGEKLRAETAADWGLIHKAFDDDALIAEARALAERLAAGPTVALGLMRRNIDMALQADLATSMQREAEAQSIAGDSADAAEGAGAFLQKRKPKFEGR